MKRPFCSAISSAFLASAPRDAVFGQGLHGLLGVLTERLLHRLPHDRREPVTTRVAFRDQLLDDAADVGECLADLARVLPRELDDLGRVPHDVILAHRLEPEGLDPDRALPDLAVPDEEAGGERLAADLRPAGRVDEKREQVLLPAVEARPAGRSLLGGLEVDGELQSIATRSAL